MINIEWIKEKVTNSDYYYSKHGDQERQNDNLSFSEIEEAANNGRIIEQYNDTGRGESCLVAGFTDCGKPVHIVCGIRGDSMVIITVYIPMPPKFITPFERG
jgi:hypothetical protein